MSVAAILLCNFLVLTQPDSIQISELIDVGNKHLANNNLEEATLAVEGIYDLYGSLGYEDVSLIKAKIIEASILERKARREQALEIINEALKIFDALAIPDIGLEAILWTKRAMIENRLGKYEESAKSAARARNLALSRDVRQDKITVNALMALSGAHFRLYQTQDAIRVTEEALEIQQQLYATDHPSTARLLNSLANRYKDLRRYDKALHYLDRALQIQENALGSDGADLANTHYNIAINLESKSLYRAAIRHYEESARITAQYVPVHPYLAEDHQKIGRCYVALGQFDEALTNYRAASEIYRQLPEEYVSQIGLLKAYSTLFEAREDYSEALIYIDKTLLLAGKKLGNKHPKYSEYLGTKAYYLTKLGQFPEAEITIREALNVLFYDSTNFNPQTITAKDHLYGQLGIAGYVHLSAYHRNKERGELLQALKYYQDATKVLELLRSNLQEEKSKILLNHQTIRIYEHLLETLYFLKVETGENHYAEQGLQVSERSRRSTVLEAVLSRQQSQFPGVPVNLFSRERKLRATVSNLENRINSVATSSNEMEQNTQIDSVRKELFYSRQQLHSFLDSIAVAYPKYYHHRLSTEVPDIKGWQVNLQIDQCIIEYFDGKDHIYAFALTADDLQMIRIEKSKRLLDGKKQFLTHLTISDTILSDPIYSLKVLGNAAHDLYTHLIEPVLPSGITDVLIVPDGLEAPLAFGVFLTDDPAGNDPRDWSYLFQKSNVHYAQSILAWQEQRSLAPNPEEAFLGLAPAYQESPDMRDTMDQPALALLVRSGQMHLPGAESEVLAIQQIMSGEVFVGKKATERRFVESAGDHRILHISAHSVLNHANPELSKLILTNSHDDTYDDALTAAEICHLDLNADLAVLSACQTGTGKINRGEGVMSLGRAFSFAGVPATIMSLWRVPDASTAQLMPAFYQALQKGMPKHKALNIARSDYLRQAKVLQQRHPYFWAGFILYGDTKPLQWSSKMPVLSWLSILIVFIVVGIFWRKFSS